MKKLPKFGFNVYKCGVFQFVIQQADEKEAVKDLAYYIQANQRDPSEYSYKEFNKDNDTVYELKMFLSYRGYIVDIAVIDHAVNGLFFYNIDSDWDTEEVETFLTNQGRHVSNCSWGVFDGEITDLRNE